MDVTNLSGQYNGRSRAALSQSLQALLPSLLEGKIATEEVAETPAEAFAEASAEPTAEADDIKGGRGEAGSPRSSRKRQRPGAGDTDTSTCGHSIPADLDDVLPAKKIRLSPESLRSSRKRRRPGTGEKDASTGVHDIAADIDDVLPAKKARLSPDESLRSLRKRQRPRTSDTDTSTGSHNIAADPDDALPAKKIRLSLDKTTASSGSVDSRVVCSEIPEPILYHPIPASPKYGYASFLEKSAEPAPAGYSPGAVSSFVSDWAASLGGNQEFSSFEGHPHRSQSIRAPPFDISPSVSCPVSASEYLQRSVSAPAKMGSKGGRRAGGQPPTPSLSRDVSAPSLDAGSPPSDGETEVSRYAGKSLVEDRMYRSVNLREHHVFLGDNFAKCPDHISELVKEMSKDRTSPIPSVEAVERDIELQNLEARGVEESSVEEYFSDNIFPKPRAGDVLQRTTRMPMHQNVLPRVKGSTNRMSTPLPDLVYGYDRDAAFNAAQQVQLNSMGRSMIVNTARLHYPFFIIEFKGEGGSMWVATNQCLGGSTACVNVAEKLNVCARQLRRDNPSCICDIQSTAFSVALNGSEARLYISWKTDDLKFHTQKMKSFAVQDPKQFLEFRKQVRNILDWGRDQRLKAIQGLLDTLLEESRKTSAQRASDRSGPSNAPSDASAKRRKSTS